jgi:hypothetical protein
MIVQGQIDNFKCICGSTTFQFDIKNHLEKNCVMVCVTCLTKYRNEGADDKGGFVILRQGAMSEEWLPDERMSAHIN